MLKAKLFELETLKNVGILIFYLYNSYKLKNH